MKTKDQILLEDAYDKVNNPKLQVLKKFVEQGFELMGIQEYLSLLHHSKEYEGSGNSPYRKVHPLDSDISVGNLTQVLGKPGLVDNFPESGEDKLEVVWYLNFFNKGAIAELFGVFDKEYEEQEPDFDDMMGLSPEEGWQIVVNPYSKTPEVLDVLKKVIPEN